MTDKLFKQHKQDKDKCGILLKQQREEIISLLQEGVINDATFRVLNAHIVGYMYDISK